MGNMLISITSSVLCGDDFLKRIELIASSGADRIILREKQLDEKSYTALAEKCLDICKKYGTAFSVNSFVDAARKLDADLHVPLFMLENEPSLAKEFSVVGVSVHSPDEAKRACGLGASYLVAGHIFATDCKKGLPPRGTGYLSDVVSSADIPVFAIGGINVRNCQEVFSAGAGGICVMSELMVCPADEIRARVAALKSAFGK